MVHYPLNFNTLIMSALNCQDYYKYFLFYFFEKVERFAAATKT